MKGSLIVRSLVWAAALFFLARAGQAWGGGSVPDWLRELSKQPVPNYGSNLRGVQLLDEVTTTVNSNGEIRTRYRRAWKILSTSGSELAYAGVHFDADTRIADLHAWSISPKGEEYTIRERDAVESAAFDGELYADQRIEVVRIPAADPGSVVGFEYEQRQRPIGYEATWRFQGLDPVVRARFTLVLPQGWTHDDRWFNFSATSPITSSNGTYVWELQNVPAIHEEAGMPPRQAVEGRLSIALISPADQKEGRVHRSWRDVGRWYDGLTTGRRTSTPALKSRVTELTASKPALLDKLAAVAAFAQRDIRYVAIEIGIGGYQPHQAGDIFRNRFGDCKDKVTVLAAMLHELGLQANYVLVNDERGVIDPQFASTSGFNHVIIAIHIPSDLKPELDAMISSPGLGKLLIFDPTNPTTPLGQLPPYLQAGRGLLVTDAGGELIDLPVAPAESTKKQVTAKMTLTLNGLLDGDISEQFTGSIAARLRQKLMEMPEPERLHFLERRVAGDLGQTSLRDLAIDNLEAIDQELRFRYHVTAVNYTKQAASLMLIRPRLLGRVGESLVETSGRLYPYETSGTEVEINDFEIRLPPGLAVDELPAPTALTSPAADYRSEVTASDGKIHYRRRYEVKAITVPADKLPELNRVSSAILADERASAVLKTVG